MRRSARATGTLSPVARVPAAMGFGIRSIDLAARPMRGTDSKWEDAMPMYIDAKWL